MAAPRDLSVYIHYPFCKSKCPYCDFNSHVRESVDSKEFLAAYKKEIAFFADKISDRKITSIFFGGGTPSLMSAEFVSELLNEIGKKWQVREDMEITLEANPTSIEVDKFRGFKEAGINRISVGVQSLDADDLKFLGREHTAKEALGALEIAAKYFDNYSFDLIYGRPNQELDDWKFELESALKYAASHLSLYQLTIEKGTPFYKDRLQGNFVLPDDSQLNLLYDLTSEILEKYGLYQYEVSNYAKPGFESMHNLNYWFGGDYLGLGAGAHGRVFYDGEKRRRQIMQTHLPENWLKSIKENGNAIQENIQQSEGDYIIEMVMMGLRTKFGISLDLFRRRFDCDLMSKLNENRVNELIKYDLLELNDKSLVATNKGFRLLNYIVAEIV